MTCVTAPTWAVIPSAGRELLHDCITSLTGQVDGIVVVANGPLRGQPIPGAVTIDDTTDTPNISRWWNLGIDYYAAFGAPEWNALIVNDDVVVPPHTVAALAGALRNHGVAMAYPNQHDEYATIWREAKPVSLFHRITGYCFMLRGENGLRFDETLAWWFGDDDADWRARETGGAALVPGCRVEHRAANGWSASHPELSVQAGRDRQTFLDKWGRAPW